MVIGMRIVIQTGKLNYKLKTKKRMIEIESLIRKYGGVFVAGLFGAINKLDPGHFDNLKY